MRLSTPSAMTALALVGGLCVADLPLAHAESLQFQVMTVRATGVGPCDERLVSLRPRLRRVSGYRGFELVDEVRRTIIVRSETAIRLPEGRILRVLPKSFIADVLKMQVRLSDGAGLEHHCVPVEVHRSSRRG